MRVLSAIKLGEIEGMSVLLKLGEGLSQSEVIDHDVVWLGLDNCNLILEDTEGANETVLSQDEEPNISGGTDLGELNEKGIVDISSDHELVFLNSLLLCADECINRLDNEVSFHIRV